MNRFRYSGGGVFVAVVGAGVVMGLAGCGPNTLASNATTPSSSPSQSPMSTASAGNGSAGMMASGGNASGSYQFRTLDDPADLTFNQLLGINNHDVIAGYFGSGAAGHPNKGYLLSRTPAGFKGINENVPGSVQTQVTGLNDRGVTVGFSSGMNNANQSNDNTGFVNFGGTTRSVKFPTGNNASPPVNQLLGVNNRDVAVGFYNDAQGNSHGYTYRVLGGRFHSVMVPGAASLTAAAINDSGDVAGFFTNSAGTTEGFLQTGGRTATLSFPGASMTQALGVNDFREVVGVYQVGSGSAAKTHGFTWSRKHGFKTVDDPQGVGATTVNGVNDEGQLVGFYTDGAGNTDGFAAAPMGQAPFGPLVGIPPVSASPTAMPSMPASTMMPSTAPASGMGSAPAAAPSSMPARPTAPASKKQTPPAKHTAPAGAPSPVPSALQPTHW